MNKFRLSINILAIAIFTFAFASIAQAQATRTWVSGVGDDVNPCSRTAPCKTFAGAISKTFINGEIDCLDEGGFGTLTVTRSITIEGTFGSGFGSTLASGTTGFLINVPTSANDPLATVRLRNLSITGTGASGAVGTRTGVRGVRILQATNVYIENCLITDFANEGIKDERTANGGLFVSDTNVRNNAGVGIFMTGTGNVKGVFNRVTSNGNSNGFVVSGGTNIATIRDSVASNNSSDGFGAQLTGQMEIINCLSSYNASGIDANNVGTVIRVSRTTVTRNTAQGLNFAGGSIFSYGNNEVAGNAGNNGPFTINGPTLQ